MKTERADKKPRNSYVYIVELDPLVLQKKKFREENPGYIEGLACYYVGMTGLTPHERFANHKRGYKASKYVRDFGIRLRPDLYDKYNPLSRIEAEQLEVRIAKRLRSLGHAVWQR